MDDAKDEIKKRVEKKYAEFKKNKVIIDKAKAILDKYGTSDDIPLEELNPQKTGIDEATLLAFCELFESDHKRGNAYH